jgi:asparagine N-glycosylation enzyme membrane subunit Stt3
MSILISVIIGLFVVISGLNLFMYIVTTSIKKEEIFDFDDGFLGYRLRVKYPSATLWQTVSYAACFAITIAILKGFWWNLFFGLGSAIFLSIACFVIHYFYKRFSETKLEKKQGYLCILNLLALATILMIAGVIR